MKRQLTYILVTVNYTYTLSKLFNNHSEWNKYMLNFTTELNVTFPSCSFFETVYNAYKKLHTFQYLDCDILPEWPQTRMLQSSTSFTPWATVSLDNHRGSSPIHYLSGNVIHLHCWKHHHAIPQLSVLSHTTVTLITCQCSLMNATKYRQHFRDSVTTKADAVSWPEDQS